MMVTVNKHPNNIIRQCRLCGKYARNWKNLFKSTIKVYQDSKEKGFSLKPISVVIKECLNFSVAGSDNNQLPKAICTGCINKLSSWQKFQKLCAKQQCIFSCSSNDSINNNSYEQPIKNCNSDTDKIRKKTTDTDVIQKSLRSAETIVKNKEIKFKNAKAQVKRNKVKSDNGTDVPAVETNRESSRFKEIQKEEEHETKLREPLDTDSNVNIKRSRACASRCTYCKTIFKTKEEQIFHRGSVTGCAFLCHKCPKEFQLKFSLRKHLETHEEQRKYCCHVCGNLFMTMACLKCHIQLHDRGSKKFKCPQCPKQFHQTNQLNQHLRVHTGEKPHACSECPRRFNQRFQLDRHVEGVHKKVKKHRCPTCGKNFLYNNNFKAHLMRHSGQKDAECNICKKSFVTKNALFRHQRFHTGEKPFPCPECGKLFADCSNRKRHVIQYHGISCAENIGKYYQKDREMKSSKKVLCVLADSIEEDDDGQGLGIKPNTLRTFFESQEILLNEKFEESINVVSDDKNSIDNINNNDDSNNSSGSLPNSTVAIINNESSNINSINSVLKNLENGELTVTVLNEQNGECLQLMTTDNLLQYENMLINNNTNSMTTAGSSEFPNVKNKLIFDAESNIGKQNGDHVGKRGHQLNHIFDTNNYAAIFSLPDSETVYVNSVKDVPNLIPSSFGLISDSFVSDNDFVESEPSEEQHMFTLDTVNRVVPLETRSVIKMLNTNGTILLTVPDNEDYITLPEVAVNN